MQVQESEKKQLTPREIHEAALEEARRAPGRRERIAESARRRLARLAYEAYFESQGVKPYRPFSAIGQVAQVAWMASADAVRKAVGA